METGPLSISLAVRSLGASRAFYQTLGFEAFDGDGETWAIMRRDSDKIGLFEGMFEDNMLTFSSPDARAVASALVADGYEIESGASESEDVVHFMVLDPDGNRILFDQV
ncbi:MAG: VOC family protein [Acidimicrobiia bacterium]|nr:VOC family protein [Acidimicrobiia bacterium]